VRERDARAIAVFAVHGNDAPNRSRPLAHHHDHVAERDGLGDVVRDEHDRGPVALEQGEKVLLALGA
jgi:hypothetical protein